MASTDRSEVNGGEQPIAVPTDAAAGIDVMQCVLQPFVPPPSWYRQHWYDAPPQRAAKPARHFSRRPAIGTPASSGGAPAASVKPRVAPRVAVAASLLAVLLASGLLLMSH